MYCLLRGSYPEKRVSFGDMLPEKKGNENLWGEEGQETYKKKHSNADQITGVY